MLEKEAAINEIKNDITSMVISVAEKVIEKDINEKQQIDDLYAGMFIKK